MAPAPAASRGRVVARRCRLGVEGGALVLTTQAGRREVLAAPGELTQATWVPEVGGRPESVVRECLELGRAGDSSLLVPLDDWLGADDRAVPRQPDGRAVRPLDATGSIAMRISGAGAVVAALGLRVASGTDVSVGAHEVGAGARVPVAARLLLAAWVVPGLLTLALAVTGTGSGRVVIAALTVLGAALLASVTTNLALELAGDRGLDRVDLPVTPWRPAPTVAASRAHVRLSLLSPGRDWLVGRDEHGREVWTPGPGLGGVRTARVRGAWLAFEDAEGAALQRLWWPAWGDDARLRVGLRELAARGYDVVDDPRPEPTGALWRPPPRPGAALPRRRDGRPGTFFPAASTAVFVALALVSAALDGAVSPLAAGPPVLALASASVAAGRGLRRVRDARPRSPDRLTPVLQDGSS